MGMSIDAIEQWAEENNCVIVSSEMWAIAQKTMRKYQKIQEIYQWAKDRSYLVETDDIMDKLKEVVEDGNDTTNTGSN